MRSAAPSNAAAISIGKLSGRTGVNIETIRYYERINMLPRPPRTASGRRVYGETETRTLSFIRRARELGFSLHEIRALLSLSADQAEDACSEVRQLAAGHLADVRAKIADLRAMERVLTDAVRRCDADERPGCPLIEALLANPDPEFCGRVAPELTPARSPCRARTRFSAGLRSPAKSRRGEVSRAKRSPNGGSGSSGGEVRGSPAVLARPPMSY
jgi:MerR family mercuric resistance operon transcriptional regulator